MKNQTTTRFATLAALAVVLGGCTTKPAAKDNWQDPFFPVNHSASPTRAIQERQFAAGAAEDGMLYPAHFDGDALNSLGAQKLKAMLVGRPEHGPLHVYLNFPVATADGAATTKPVADDALTLGCQSAVMRKLEALGVAPGDAIVSVGVNPTSMHPADAGIRALEPVSANVGGVSASAANNGAAK